VVANAVVAVAKAAVGNVGNACFALPLEHAPAPRTQTARRAPSPVADRVRRRRP
jgi:hypothetical protein